MSGTTGYVGVDGPVRNVLLTDYIDSEVAAEVPYLFKRAGCAVDVFCSKRSWLLKNSHWDNHILRENDPEKYVRHLESLVREKEYDFVVVTDDFTLRIVNDNLMETDLAGVILPLSTLENRMLLGSKAGLHTLCEKYGIVSPVTAIYDPSVGVGKIFEHISFPLLLKVDISGGGNGVFLCKNEDEVRTRLQSFTETEKRNLVFQRYIHGDHCGVEAFFGKGNLLAYAFSGVLKGIEGEFSSSCERRYRECREIEPILKDIGRKFGVNGFASISFIFDKKQNTYYLIEVDARPQVWFPLARFVGVDFSLAISNYFQGKNVLIRPKFPKGKDYLVMGYFSRIVNYVISYGDVREAAKWIFNKEGRWKFIPTYDKKFLFAVCVNVLRIQAAHIYNFKHFGFLRAVHRKVKYGVWSVGLQK